MHKYKSACIAKQNPPPKRIRLTTSGIHGGTPTPIYLAALEVPGEGGGQQGRSALPSANFKTDLGMG